jgi:pimeloyl-ACP methyl ester carboxylesterase
MAAIPATRYVKSDDIHVAYQVVGDGPLDLLLVPGFVSHVEAVWQSAEASAFLRRLASFSRLILFDKRGTGMSDRGSQNFTLEQRMHDVRAILDEVGSERAVLFGVSEGGPMSLLYAATYPERTAALVLYGTYAKRSWAPDYPWGWKDEQWDGFLGNMERNWGTPEGISVDMWAPSFARDRHTAERMASYYRAAASPGAAVAIMRMNTACTPANASSSAMTSPASRCTSARASPGSRPRARFWSRRPCATWWPAPGWRSRSAAPTRSRACRTSGACSARCWTELRVTELERSLPWTPPCHRHARARPAHPSKKSRVRWIAGSSPAMDAVAGQIFSSRFEDSA